MKPGNVPTEFSVDKLAQKYEATSKAMVAEAAKTRRNTRASNGAGYFFM